MSDDVVARLRRLAGRTTERDIDLLRGMCPRCDGGGCGRCDYTGFRGDQRTYSIGYGWRRLVFWPWHYVQHVRRGRVNGWYSVVFCTFCVDDRLNATEAPDHA